MKLVYHFYTNYFDSNNYSFISSIVPGVSADSGNLKIFYRSLFEIRKTPE